jgi:single-strand DNA-binding protein
MSYSKAEIAGFIARDPDLRWTPNGRAVCSFSIPVSRGKDKENQITDWYNITVWGDEGERAAQNFSKGDRVKVKGRLQQRFYEHNGERKFSVDVIALEGGVEVDN